MGNDKSKGSALPALDLFAEEEQMRVKKLFDHICGEGTSLQANDFKLHVEKSLHECFVNPLYHCLAAAASRKNGIDLSAFASLLSRIFKGTVEERAALFIQLASGDVHSSEIEPKSLLLFVGHLIDEFYRAMAETREFCSWESLLVKGSSEKLAACLVRQVCFPEWTNKEKPVSSELPSNSLSIDAVEKWLMKTPLITCMMESVFQQCFPVLQKQSYTFPKCNVATTTKQKKSILHFEDVVGLASYLPLDVCDKWRQLFNSVTDGQSFSRFVESITKQGPTVLIAEDEDGHVFGAFASQDWKISAKFRGNGDCFLFQLNPTIEFFHTTGYNDHFFYLNQNQQTLPNGMGFGGQLDYFGMFFDSEYGIGSCSPSCTTYNSPQLSASPKFKLKFLEVWGVGPIPKKTPPSTRGSCLDKDAEAKMLLEMAGRDRVSDGLRDEEDCE